MTETGKTEELYRLSILVSLACVLQIAESMVPHPVPGLRLGLANLLTLTTLVLIGFKQALEISVLRALLSSFLMGTFMSPGFILSLSGAVTSTLAMGFLHWISGFHPRHGLSIIGISIVGALVHNMVQLYLAYFLLVKNDAIFVFLPWLSIGAVGTGWAVGVIAGGVCCRLQERGGNQFAEKKPQRNSAPVASPYAPGTSPLHRIDPKIKIPVVMGLAVPLLLVNHFLFYIGTFLFLAVMMRVSRTPVSFMYRRIRRYTWLIAAAFLFPVFFGQGKEVLATVMSFELTMEGMTNGIRFASRIVLLMVSSSLLVRTTDPRDMARGFAAVLTPLRFFGISRDRVASILSSAWDAFPDLWDTTRQAIFMADFRKAGSLRNLLPLLSEMVARLYIATEPKGNLIKK